tara:strand:+ start:6309 stop:6755 length:447 start_codon:yes stop_codon:yes gene_type:complete
MESNQPSAVALSLTVKDAEAALEFYQQAFGAVELFRMGSPDGSVGHAEFQIGETRIFISGEFADWQAFAMPEGSRSSCLFCINIENCDAATAQAKEAGAEVLVAPEDNFWGMRSSVLLDPYGYRWTLGQVIEELSPDEVKRRAEQAFS